MKIGIDARWIFKEISGVGAYTRELIKHLVKTHPENKYVLFFDDEIRAGCILKDMGLENDLFIETVILPYGIFSVSNQLKLPSLLQELKLDIFHSTNYMVPFVLSGRSSGKPPYVFITVHDLIPLLYPHYAPRSLKTRFFLIYKYIMRRIIKSVDAIITVSEHSKRDVVSYFGLPENKIFIIPEAVSTLFQQQVTLNSSINAKVGKKRILWVGRLDPYKNLCGVIEAFYLLLQKTGMNDIELRIICAPDRRYPEAFMLIDGLGLKDKVKWLGYVADEELVKEYKEASLFVLTSFYEGFGLPVLEAMASGVPVICSNRASLPEVAGDAAIKVEPDDKMALADAMQKILTDMQLAAELREKGFMNIKRFDWNKTAELTIKAYKEISGL